MSAFSGGELNREKDSKFKAYAQTVERALKTFENPNEWADLISALGKLVKVFQSNAKFREVPNQVTVAKRLSQCLHPALPMGVHLKALEAYRQVFEILGPQKLAEVLYLFAVGLFPLMDHCGIKVKSQLFSIFEEFLVPLGSNLRPALPGFLGGVLLALEEGTEFYKRSFDLLDSVCEKVGPRAFYACLWQSVLGSPPVRLPAMIYVNGRFDKLKPLDDQIHIIGDHVNHMVAALCATADDVGSPLVQRYLLDFLVSAFPLDSSNLTDHDFVQLLRRCLFVVLRRDMSLNRRLYTWLINRSGENRGVSGLSIGGPDDGMDMSFFNERVLGLVKSAIKEYLELDTIEVQVSNSQQVIFGGRKEADQIQFAEVRVCRLLLYLQDRADIGKSILDTVFPLFLQKAAEYHRGSNSNEVAKDAVIGRRDKLRLNLNLAKNDEEELESNDMESRRMDELSKTFNMLLNSLEPGFIWNFLAEWYDGIVAKMGEDNTAKRLIHGFSQVVSICIEMCNVESDANVRATHLPKLLECVLRGLSSHRLVESSNLDDVLTLYNVCQKLLKIITANPPSPIEVIDTPEDTSSLNQTNEITAIEHEGSQIDACLSQLLLSLSSTFEMYSKDRREHWIPLLDASSELLHHFLGVPIYHIGFENIEDMRDEVPCWLINMLKVIDGKSWLREMKESKCCDVSARVSILELLCKIYTKSASVIEQHDEALNRNSGNDDDPAMMTVLLKPLLSKRDLQYLESQRIFEMCAESVWIGVASQWCCKEQQRLSKLLLDLHSRKASEASSEVENIIVHSLTSSDDMMCTSAAKTFHKIWVLARNSIEEIGRIVYRKPFNRAVMILLGVLADESVSRTRTELKAAASAWFSDCAKHNDLPRIVQMLSTMLMNPVTARISIQYLRQESKLVPETCSSLPAGTSAVTLLTIDGKQRLYHINGPSCNENAQWISEVRNKLLLSPTEDVQAPEAQRHVSPCPASVDMPNFDDDTDSLDTLSLSTESVDAVVYETLLSIVDAVCEEEETEIERIRLNKAVFSNLPQIEAEGTNFTVEESGETSVVKVEEKPAPICDPVQRVKRGHRRQDSLQESIFTMTEKDLSAFDTSEILRPSTDSNKHANAGTISSSSSTNSTASPLFEELHIHMLLYGESGKVVDLGRAETAFRILTALLSPRGATGNRMLVTCLISSGTTSSTPCSPEESSLVDLMTRHVRAIVGQHFWSSSSSEDDVKHKHITLLELLITISLHYLRSYFLNSPISPVTEADLAALWKCKISALEFLSELIHELSSLLNEHQSKKYVMFVQSILTRSKLQKCLLHLLLTAVNHDPQECKSKNGNLSLSVSISEFNEGLIGGSSRLSPLLSAYHRSLLALTAHAIRLEHDIKHGFIAFSDNVPGPNSINPSYNQSFNRASSREPNASLVELRAFLLILLGALKKQPHRHEMWLQFVIHILPWMERSLATIVCRVVEQLCRNMENALMVAFETSLERDTPITDEKPDPAMYPANYLAMTLESLTTLVHFCVIDNSNTAAAIQTNPANTPVNTSTSSVVGHAMSVIPGSKVATELFSQLGKVFSLTGDSSGVGIPKIDSNRQHSNGWRQAQSDMLSSLPHSLATVCNVWTVVRKNQDPVLPIGTTAQLRRLVLQLLSEIAKHHEHAFLTSLALVWLTRTASKPMRKNDPDKAVFEYSPAQLDITNLLLSLKVIPFEDLISSVNATLKEASLKANKVGITIDKANFPTEEPLLELVHSCMSVVSQGQVRLCWAPLLSLFSEAPLSSLSPRAVFLLFVILSDFVKYVGGAYIVEDKTMYRNVQDVCAKLAESVNTIVGWQLETTTWLKRTLVVKQDHSNAIRSVDQSPIIENASSVTNVSSTSIELPQSTRNSTLSLINKPTSLDTLSTSSTLTEGRGDKKSASNLRASIKDTNNNKRDPTHSTQALFLLADRLTDLLDSVSKSDEKDKVLPILNGVWANVVPYLKAKNARNARFFLASSQLLASMSSYSYMRPVWKKTTLDLLLDSSFFKMDHQSLKQWLIVTDHLMTHDRTSFKDLLKSISYNTNASFSIMTSKEQEYEARAQSLKRLTFVVFGSQLDQYHGQMNDIQERLSDNLRVSQSPVIRSAVFLCIRVLLLRLRPHSLIGVWPIMVTELVHALSQLEQQLHQNVGFAGGEEMLGSQNDQWMQLYLSACKLLEALCTLPSGYLSHFQMFHWAFVSSVSSDKTEIFKPFAERINELLIKKYGELSSDALTTHSASLAGIKILTSFEELRPFFYTLANLNKSVPGLNDTLRDATALSGNLSYKNAVCRLENSLYVDFSEHLQF